MTRYVRKDRRIYDFSYCKLCGAAGGCDSNGCTTMTCVWCGTPQCSVNGLGRGQCAICYHGFLPGWAGSHENQACSYKGCVKPAVGVFPRKGRACADHGARILGADYLSRRLAERDRLYEIVEVSR